MSVTLNAFEIYEIAEQIERNGAKFYRAAAGALKDESTAKTLLRLADMEDKHEKTYADMRKALSEQERELTEFDPENDSALYLQAMAGGHVFDLRNDPAKRLTGTESVSDILKIAIGAEKDSIVFYLGLKDFVYSQAGRDKVEAIINEEMRHIAVLNQKLLELQ
jgi:rubrerythrin